MRILLPTLYDTRGGSTRVLLAAATALAERHAVTVRAPLPEAHERTPADFPSQPLESLPAKLAVLPRLAGLVARETRALRRLRPEVIHVHDEPSLAVYGLAARALRPRPFVLWHLHAPTGGGRAAPLLARLADACILLGPHAEAPGGLPARVVRNPLPRPVRREAPSPALPGLAVVGALTHRKGQDRALEAFAVFCRRPGTQDARLTLIGPALDLAFAQALRDRAAALGLADRVVLAGERPADRAFEGVGLALFPSRAEMQPLALAEAMARGLPVVASDIPAHRAMLTEAGADPAALAAPEPERFADAILSAARQPPPPDLAERVAALHAPDRFAADLEAALAALVPPERNAGL
ncbi:MULTISPECIES: glycosyltransferase [Methylobacterium]|uniref:Glycosyltransferase subfamily 4-like N-terminal domain-containing protein n=2 Tax=Pseudomonadota TaxID=1224 RepID=A0ABQ4SPC1_9HYPH|nr:MULTISPECIES: glycosyltransferase [Methylobacterium]PIU08102.1 MAG: hypothetical protein COT56_02715 [Methylobacterium sp. CG09_land_8_20_14_0_10_71_15]PIU15556.1 MAG: hypothetical protein COT28_04040 [Methylobacterium sp. CG08_land_8_20_14_0_20_71_15]GBU17580.1 hypothetical protein AwMethylo_17950 [Methylobacterium sp.]GJE05025.1 hypothetical protein AOPFMNJM_0320 [Methylobacterium jeotgali]